MEHLIYPEAIVKKYKATDDRLISDTEFLAVFYNDINEELAEKFRQQDDPNVKTEHDIRLFMQVPSGEAADIIDYISAGKFTVPVISDKKMDVFNEVTDNGTTELFKSHSNLNAVHLSPVKSIGWETNVPEIKIQPTVVFLCDKKHIVPAGEQPFPKTYAGFQTDVREGWIDVISGRAPARGRQSQGNSPKTVQIGSQITSRVHGLSGTVGSFVRDKATRTLGFVTSYHMFCSSPPCMDAPLPDVTGEVVQLNNGQEAKVTKSCPCIDHQFKGQTHLIDAAFVTISPTTKHSSAIDQTDSNIYPELPPRIDLGNKCGDILSLPPMTRVFKCGAQSQLTKGFINSQYARTAARIRCPDFRIRLGGNFIDIQEATIDTRIFIAKHFVAVQRAGGERRFFADDGDSGSVVFHKDHETQNIIQIGMVTAICTDNTVLISPLAPVLDALKVELAA